MTKPDPEEHIDVKSAEKGAGYAILGVVVILLLLWVYGVYRGGWTSSFITKPAQWLHMPIAYVDGTLLTYPSFAEDVRVLKEINDQNTELSLNKFTPDEQGNNILDRHIQVAVLKKLAERYEVDLTLDDAVELFDKGNVLPGLPNGPEAYEELGLSKESFVSKVIYPILLADAVNEVIVFDKDVQSQVFIIAEDVLRQLQGGANFEELAQQYSEDPGSAIDGGSLGWFGRGVMVSEFEDAAFALKPGEVSGLVESAFGVHIIKLEKERESESGERELNARHILFSALGAESIAKDLQDELTIWRFLKW